MKISNLESQIINKSQTPNHKRFGILNFGNWNLFGNCPPSRDPPEGEKLPASPSESEAGEIGNSESGITLVISIVMLASITFVSFALSTVIIREIRSAQTILQTEPAISGASSGGEIGLFRFLREAGGTTTSGSTPQSGASFEVVADLYDSPYLFSSSNGQLVQVGLYDADQPSNQSANYGTVTVTNNAGGSPIKVDVFSWGDLATPIWSTTISPGSSRTSPNLSQVDDRYLVSIDPVPASGSATGQVTATDNSGGPKGIPSPNPGITVTGSKGDLQRRIQIDFQ